ncbi:MAG: S8 family serine peptidase [Bryobacteraceae bacterium]
MKYLVLKRRPADDGNEFLEMAGAGATRGGEFELPFEAETADISEGEADGLRQDPGIADVIASMPFTLVEPVATDGPADGAVWGLDAVGATASPFTGAGVTVAVIDTGIDRAHAAFAGIAFGPENLCDFTASEEGVPGDAPDVHGHGTHVAGTIFGRAVDGERIGVAPGVTRVLIGKVLGPGGKGSTAAIYNAIQWALARRADVISMSLGMDFPGQVQRLVDSGLPPDIAASRALEAYRSNVRLFDRVAESVRAAAARGRGALLVAASGNESRRHIDPRFTVAVAPPAAADGFVSVGAVGRTGNAVAPFSVARFSNTGCLLSAPGVGIRSAALGGGLTGMDGTSMATPHVAGVIALWTQKLFPGGQRGLGWAGDVQRSLENSAIPPPGLARADVGLGVVRAPAA